MRQRLARALRLLVVVAAVLVQGALAHAHTFEPALLDLRERGTGVFDVVWRPPGKESGALMPGEPDLVPRLPASCQDRGSLGSSDEMRAFRVDCGPARLRGETIAVPGVAGSRVDVIVRVSWNDGHTESGVLRSDAEEWAVPAGPSGGMLLLGAPTRTVAARYLALGVDHILRGPDHAVLVLGLFLLVGGTRALVAAISAFTVAHSLTLAAAVLGLVRVPTAPVEALIALSIVVLARELLRDPDEAPTLAQRSPWAMAFTFGLLYGLGLADALAQTGVPADQIPLALVAFNVGIEAGQLALVATLIAAATVLRGVGARVPAVRRVAPYALGAVAVMWTIERILRFWQPLT